MSAPTSNWRYDPQRDCYVEQTTGMTGTLESLLRAQSQAQFNVPDGTYGLQNYQNAYKAAVSGFYIAPSWSPAPLGTVSMPAVIGNDEFAWLRARVDEICWKAA